MKKAIIIGKTNVGKSLFLVNFSEFLGYRKVYIKIEYPDGKKLNKEMSIDIARSYLSSRNEFKTQCLQSIDMKIPVYKGKKEIKIIDSSGLVDGIHPDMKIRNSIVQTIETLKSTDVIIHIVDITEYLNDDFIHNISEIDKQIMKYGTTCNYLLLANKIDLDKDNKGLSNVKKYFKDSNIIPISALYKRGFKEVKSFVVKYI
ncbi:HSR1-like GTP-binding protein [Gottschalkia purinilytica]|uniref:HSR1-like GTP-binding protein n=1 Tax=Gottschalkia purinilytica TaxID=1503 RepID=A0A0L0WBP7_GOTPU|nr:GTPase [Gottschalkia purinilytica]KNF08918.1 HSR1-like GTP-binding protein [Gottschalkia purinilytica]